MDFAKKKLEIYQEFRFCKENDFLASIENSEDSGDDDTENPNATGSTALNDDYVVEFMPILSDDGSTLVLEQKEPLICTVCNKDYSKTPIAMLCEHAFLKGRRLYYINDSSISSCTGLLFDLQTGLFFGNTRSTEDVLNIFFDDIDGQFKRHPEFLNGTRFQGDKK